MQTALLALAAAVGVVLVAGEAPALSLLADEHPPFHYAEGGRVAGLAAEIVTEALARARIPAKTELLPWDQAYVRAQAERETCLYTMARLENRERLFLWVGPIASNLWAVYGRPDFEPTIRALADLKPWRIGVVARDPKIDYLRENGVNDLRQADSDIRNPTRLFLPRGNPDRIDLWMTDLYEARATARAAQSGEVKLVFIALEQPLFLACSPRTAPETIAALTAAFESLRADGTIERIKTDYERRFGR